MPALGPERHIAVPRDLGRFRGEADINGRVGPAGPVAIDPDVWSGRALQVDFAELAVTVLHQCIRPLHGAFVLLAIMDIRAHPISF
jgi:hypothetical protein